MPRFIITAALELTYSPVGNDTFTSSNFLITSSVYVFPDPSMLAELLFEAVRSTVFVVSGISNVYVLSSDTLTEPICSFVAVSVRVR